MILPSKRNGTVLVNDPTTHSPLLNALKNEAHVYVAFPERHSESRLLAWYRDLLSEEECEKHNSFHFDRDRDLYLLTHGLLRATLSNYFNTAPDQWVFTYSPRGRPEIAPTESYPPLRFSVSRTKDLIVCLIVLSIDAGVDVERIRKLDHLKTLSKNVFTTFEISRLRDLPESDRMEEFFNLWTLKEAYIKARGTGLSLPLDRFAFYSDAAGCVRISFDAEFQDIPSDWQFASFRPTPSHALAVALRREERSDLKITFFEALPEPNSLPLPFLKPYPLKNLNDFTPK